jgi:hypothetical protein
MRLILLLMMVIFFTGCASAPVQVNAPEREFAPTAPALIRLPVVILLPTRAEMVQHLTSFFETELGPKMDVPIQLPGAKLKFSITDLWAKIQEPIYLDKGIWLLIHPQTLSLGTARSDAQNPFTAQASLETTANPEVLFGQNPIIAPQPLPSLSKYIPGPPIFQAVSNAFISYGEANKQLKDPRLKLIGMVLKGTGQKLTIDDIHLSGEGAEVIMRVKLHYEPLIINLGSKPAKLTVYLKGTPHYLPKLQAFDLPDLDYDIKSSDLMVQIADMVFKNDFKNQLRQMARLPIGPQMDKLKVIMDKALNRNLGPYIRLSANVTTLKVLDGLANNKGIVIRVSIQGAAALEVKWN